MRTRRTAQLKGMAKIVLNKTCCNGNSKNMFHANKQTYRCISMRIIFSEQKFFSLQNLSLTGCQSEQLAVINNLLEIYSIKFGRFDQIKIVLKII